MKKLLMVCMVIRLGIALLFSSSISIDFIVTNISISRRIKNVSLQEFKNWYQAKYRTDIIGVRCTYTGDIVVLDSEGNVQIFDKNFKRKKQFQIDPKLTPLAFKVVGKRIKIYGEMEEEGEIDEDYMPIGVFTPPIYKFRAIAVYSLSGEYLSREKVKENEEEFLTNKKSIRGTYMPENLAESLWAYFQKRHEENMKKTWYDSPGEAPMELISKEEIKGYLRNLCEIFSLESVNRAFSKIETLYDFFIEEDWHQGLGVHTGWSLTGYILYDIPKIITGMQILKDEMGDLIKEIFEINPLSLHTITRSLSEDELRTCILNFQYLLSELGENFLIPIILDETNYFVDLFSALKKYSNDDFIDYIKALIKILGLDFLRENYEKLPSLFFDSSPPHNFCRLLENLELRKLEVIRKEFEQIITEEEWAKLDLWFLKIKEGSEQIKLIIDNFRSQLQENIEDEKEVEEWVNEMANDTIIELARLFSVNELVQASFNENFWKAFKDKYWTSKISFIRSPELIRAAKKIFVKDPFLFGCIMEDVPFRRNESIKVFESRLIELMNENGYFVSGQRVSLSDLKKENYVFRKYMRGQLVGYGIFNSSGEELGFWWNGIFYDREGLIEKCREIISEHKRLDELFEEFLEKGTTPTKEITIELDKKRYKLHQQAYLLGMMLGKSPEEVDKEIGEMRR